MSAQQACRASDARCARMLSPAQDAEKIVMQRLYATKMGGAVGSTAHASATRDGRGSTAIFRLRHGRHARQALLARGAEKIAIQRLYATTMGGVVGSTAHASVSRDGRGSIAIFRLRHGRYARQALVTRRE